VFLGGEYLLLSCQQNRARILCVASNRRRPRTGNFISDWRKSGFIDFGLITFTRTISLLPRKLSLAEFKKYKLSRLMECALINDCGDTAFHVRQVGRAPVLRPLLYFGLFCHSAQECRGNRAARGCSASIHILAPLSAYLPPTASIGRNFQRTSQT
jgi:hypothetical protein